MSNLANNEMSDLAQRSLDLVAEALRDAADSAHALSEEASQALSHAADDIGRVVEKLRSHGVDAARQAARQAANEVQKHPVAALAAALTAVVALMGVIRASRSGKDSAT